MSNVGTSNFFVHSLLRAHNWQHRPQLDGVCDWWRAGGHGVCALRNSPEISSLFDRKPKAPAFQTLARIQNTIACGFGSNKATEIGKLFRD